MFITRSLVRCLNVFGTFGLFAILVGCASNPMKERLERNFVYNCSLQMIDKSVPAADAERICTSSHNAEMEEKRFNAGIKAARRGPQMQQGQPSQYRVPASQPAGFSPSPHAAEPVPQDSADSYSSQ